MCEGEGCVIVRVACEWEGFVKGVGHVRHVCML